LTEPHEKITGRYGLLYASVSKMFVIMQSLIYLAAESTDKTPNQNWKLYGERTAYAQYLTSSNKKI